MATKIDLLDAFAEMLAEKIAEKISAGVIVEPEEEAPAPAKKAAPATKGKAAAPATKGKAAAPAAKGKAKAVTLVEVRDALREVSQKLGKDVALGILGEFDCTKVSEVEEGDYAELVTACTEALSTAEEEGEEEEDDDI